MFISSFWAKNKIWKQHYNSSGLVEDIHVLVSPVPCGVDQLVSSCLELPLGSFGGGINAGVCSEMI